MVRPRLKNRPKEINVCGWQAVCALFEQHPGEIRRLYFDASTGKRAGSLCSYLAHRRKVYRQLPSAELERVAATLHHGGIVAVIAERPLHKVTRETIDGWASARMPLLLLDRVSNANNLGAIVRTAAFFGVKSIVVPDHPSQALPGDATWRVAEGGMEFVEFYRVPALTDFCATLKRSYFLVGSSLAGRPLRVALDAAASRPVALILGNEEQGIAPAVASACDRLVKIPGGDSVQSLNVSAAAAVLCWELFGRD
ncbi:MAG TPA: RNA methyltransferase [Steroidobacteraceae bacterium]|nr:RNA methyltransferase [Steroidobacteraceae bacterium]